MREPDGDSRFDHSPVRKASSDSWVAERDAPLSSTSSIPLDTYPSRLPNPSTVDARAQSYPLADLDHDPVLYDPLPEPGDSRGLAPHLYTHPMKGIDESSVTVVELHPTLGTDIVNRTALPQSDLR